MADYLPMGSDGPIGLPVSQAPINVTVNSSSTQIVPANENRRFLTLSNIGNKDVFLSGDGTALINKGLQLAKGDTLILDQNLDITTSIHGITVAGSSIIAIQEFE